MTSKGVHCVPAVDCASDFTLLNVFVPLAFVLAFCTGFVSGTHRTDGIDGIDGMDRMIGMNGWMKFSTTCLNELLFCIRSDFYCNDVLPRWVYCQSYLQTGVDGFVTGAFSLSAPYSPLHTHTHTHVFTPTSVQFPCISCSFILGH